MAFLSSFRIGQQTVYPEELQERLKSFALLENVGDCGAAQSAQRGQLVRAAGRHACWSAAARTMPRLFLVVTGSLGVFVENEQGQRQMVAHVPAGETVGEMSLIAGSSSHNAQLVALRDTELLRISPDGFEALIARHPRVMMNLMQMLVRRLKDANRGRSPQVAAQDLRHRAAAGRAVRSADRPAPGAGAGADRRAAPRCWMPRPATRPRNGSTASSRRTTSSSIAAMRPTVPGRICACARPTASFFWRAPTSRCRWRRWTCRPSRRALRACRNCCCCIPTAPAPCCRNISPCAAGCSPITHHLRAGHQADVARVARFIAGRAVGLVLAGGGARGFAHIGIIKALKEAGVPFDQLGGTSMGAIIAAGLAREWSLEEMTRPDAGGVRGRQSAVRFHPAADRAGARQESQRPAARAFRRGLRSRNCRCPSSRFPPTSPPGASISIARANCGGRCAPPWRCRASCRR